MVKTRHYTPLERTTFLECLKRHKELLTAFQRSLSQLKKLWTNIKQGQRNAITKERQGRLATGGGPEPASSNVDPDVAIIVPHLMETVPTAFSSNLQDFNEDIPELDRLENEISMLEKGTVRSDENARSEEEPEMSSEGEQMDGEEASYGGRTQLLEVSQESQPGPSRQRELSSVPSLNKKRQNRKENDAEEQQLRVKRLKNLIIFDKEMHDLRVKNEMEIHSIRTREANAKAELAELLLERATKSNFS